MKNLNINRFNLSKYAKIFTSLCFLFISNMTFANDNQLPADFTLGQNTIYSKSTSKGSCSRDSGLYTELESLTWNYGRDEKFLPKLIYLNESIMLHFIFSKPKNPNFDFMPEKIEIVGYMPEGTNITALSFVELYQKMSIALIPGDKIGDLIKGDLSCSHPQSENLSEANQIQDSSLPIEERDVNNLECISIDCKGTDTPFSTYEKFCYLPIEKKILKFKNNTYYEHNKTYSSLEKFMDDEFVCKRR